MTSFSLYDKSKSLVVFLIIYIESPYHTNWTLNLLMMTKKNI